jgi:hypothetical protein
MPTPEGHDGPWSHFRYWLASAISRHCPGCHLQIGKVLANHSGRFRLCSASRTITAGPPRRSEPLSLGRGEKAHRPAVLVRADLSSEPKRRTIPQEDGLVLYGQKATAHTAGC